MNTALPQRGEFNLSLKVRGEDRSLKLKFSYASMARMEEKLGCGLIKIAQEVTNLNIRIRPIVEIIYESAIEGKEKISFVELADAVVDTGIAKVSRSVMECVMKMLSAGREEMPSGEAKAEEAETQS